MFLLSANERHFYWASCSSAGAGRGLFAGGSQGHGAASIFWGNRNLLTRTPANRDSPSPGKGPCIGLGLPGTCGAAQEGRRAAWTAMSRRFGTRPPRLHFGLAGGPAPPPGRTVRRMRGEDPSPTEEQRVRGGPARHAPYCPAPTRCGELRPPVLAVEWAVPRPSPQAGGVGSESDGAPRPIGPRPPCRRRGQPGGGGAERAARRVRERQAAARRAWGRTAPRPRQWRRRRRGGARGASGLGNGSAVRTERGRDRGRRAGSEGGRRASLTRAPCRQVTPAAARPGVPRG